MYHFILNFDMRSQDGQTLYFSVTLTYIVSVPIHLNEIVKAIQQSEFFNYLYSPPLPGTSESINLYCNKNQLPLRWSSFGLLQALFLKLKKLAMWCSSRVRVFCDINYTGTKRIRKINSIRSLHYIAFLFPLVILELYTVSSNGGFNY